MAINNITQTISTIPEAAHRGVDVQTQFVIKQEDFQDHLQGITVDELNTLKDQLNSRIGEINSTTTTMNGYASTASAGASTATTKAGEASTSASEALSYKNQAETFKNNASASATKASQWSDNNYNVEVEAGRYSAKHWSTVAQNTLGTKVDKVTSTDNAIVRFDGITGTVQNSGVIIDDNGNVGIGTSTPKNMLNISKNITSTSMPDIPSMIISNKGKNPASPFIAGLIGVDTYRDISANHYTGAIWFTRNSEYSDQGSSSDICFGTESSIASNALPTERMRIDKVGNVGINNPTPNRLLTINNRYFYGQSETNGQAQIGDLIFDGSSSQRILSNAGYYGSGLFTPSKTSSAGIIFDTNAIRFTVNSGLTVGSNFTPTTRMTLDADGNVGVGTSSPTFKIDITNASSGNMVNASYTGGAKTPYIRLRVNSDTLSELSAGNSDNTCALGLKVNGTERMRIDSNGNVGIGTTPSAWGNGYPSLDLVNTGHISSGSKGGNNTLSYLSLSSNCYFDGSLWRYKGNGVATEFLQQLGSFTWRTAPSETAENPITWTNTMTLDASGSFTVGGSSTTGFENSDSFKYDKTGKYAIFNHISGTASGSGYVLFGYNGSITGSISQSGTTAVTYNTTSDYRLKENIRPADCKKFMDIKFVDYERIDGRHECGVIAHELQEVYPDLVTGEKDAVETRKVELTPAVEEVRDEDGNVIAEAINATYEEQEFPVYQQVNYMGLIARIGTVVQQQAKLIEAMQLEINELKGVK